MTSKNSKHTPSPTDSYRRFAAATINSQLPKLTEQMHGAVTDHADVEFVHQLRVATRRIRASLQVFKPCLPKNRAKDWRDAFKTLTASLGTARDLDVQLQFLNDYLASTKPPLVDGITLLLKTKKDLRDDTQADVIACIEAFQRSTIFNDLQDWCTKVLTTASPATDPPHDPHISLQAQHYITCCYHELLALKDYVYQETAAGEHHRMRIAAKHLRYATEIFSSLNVPEYKTIIPKLKQMQDLLGDLHDTDVWIDYIPRFINDLIDASGPDNTTTITALEKFLADMQQRRQQLYKDFVTFWNANHEDGLFTILDDLTRYAIVLPDDQDYTLAVLSDIHGNDEALNAVLSDIHHHPTSFILNAGDSVGFGPSPNDVLTTLCTERIISIAGNFDTETLTRKDKDTTPDSDKNQAYTHTLRSLTKANRRYLASLPVTLRLRIGNRTILMAHGSPRSSDEHLYHDTATARFKQLATTTDADVVIIGHTHIPFQRTDNKTLFLNPGSVGRPDDKNPDAAYALLTLPRLCVDLRRIPYDAKATAHRIRKQGLPEAFAQMILCGASYDTIKQRDIAIKKKRGPNAPFSTLIQQIEVLARKWDSDHAHAYQVRTASLLLYDALQPLHKLGAMERFWLEAAALLHDIGWSQGWKGHHKTSLELILDFQDLPFTIRERYLIGSIARYHRKAGPTAKHHPYGSLSSRDQRTVAALAGILRVADSLDASHASRVKTLTVTLESSQVTVVCHVQGNHKLEEVALAKKRDLFEQSFNRPLVIQWQPLDNHTNETLDSLTLARTQ